MVGFLDLGKVIEVMENLKLKILVGDMELEEENIMKELVKKVIDIGNIINYVVYFSRSTAAFRH